MKEPALQAPNCLSPTRVQFFTSLKPMANWKDTIANEIVIGVQNFERLSDIRRLYLQDEGATLFDDSKRSLDTGLKSAALTPGGMSIPFIANSKCLRKLRADISPLAALAQRLASVQLHRGFEEFHLPR
jgi:hypothetical protein